MNILITPEDEQLRQFRLELGRYTNSLEVIGTTLKLIEENAHRPTDINSKATIEDDHICCRIFGDRSMAEGCDHNENYTYTELVEK